MKTSHSLLRVRLFRIGLEACRADFSAGARPGSSRRRAQARKVAHIATQTGFTLIEVLVVIVSVAILGAIVFSATKSASRSAKSVKAVSNLKQIGVACLTYESGKRAFPYGNMIVTPATSLIALVSCTFIIVSAFCMCCTLLLWSRSSLLRSRLSSRNSHIWSCGRNAPLSSP